MEKPDSWEVTKIVERCTSSDNNETTRNIHNMRDLQPGAYFVSLNVIYPQGHYECFGEVNVYPDYTAKLPRTNIIRGEFDAKAGTIPKLSETELTDLMRTEVLPKIQSALDMFYLRFKSQPKLKQN